MAESLNHNRIPVARIKLGPDTKPSSSMASSQQVMPQEPISPQSAKPSLFIRLIALVKSTKSSTSVEITGLGEPDPDLERIARSFSNDELPPLNTEEGEAEHSGLHSNPSKSSSSSL